MSLLKKLIDRYSKPLLGLSLAGVSTTLAACYGPPPQSEAATYDYCEAFLVQACTDETIEMPANCQDLRHRLNMPSYCKKHASQAAAQPAGSQITEPQPQNTEPQNTESVVEG